jgi:16S rRNA (cytosine1402-N4)-methyltransferase
MHIPVLLKEIIDHLPADGQKFIDGTTGDGGYIREILRLNPDAKILGLDLDQTTLGKLERKFAQDGLSQRVTLVHSNFSQIKHVATEYGFNPASAVILDLGFSSTQLEDPLRGLTFQKLGPLDMRYNLDNPKTAADIVNSYSREELTEIFQDYGEEKFSAKIAAKIVRFRQTNKILDTKTLYDLIAQSLPKPVAYKAADSVRRIFQALRIEVNDELNNLRKTLPAILEILEPGGRMLVVSFHSLEDRIVKEFFVNEAKDCVCPPDFPTCVCGKNPQLRILTKKNR